MTGLDDTGGKAKQPPADRIAAYRRTATWPPVQNQIDHLLDDLSKLQTLTAAGHLAAAGGAALAAAHQALVLAATPTVDDGARSRRCAVLRDVVVPALGRAGLGHVGVLVEAGLAHDSDPAAVARGARTVQ